MPTTRKASGGRGATASGKQSTLSFNHRVTKSVPKSAKDAVITSAVTKKEPAPEKSKLSQSITAEDVVETPDVDEPAEVEEDEAPAVPEKSEAEVKALKITDAQVKRYWNNLEAQRKAKRVHQEDLTVSEKVLRYFDVSSQYGPCIGITRMKRWQRAEKLGLNPPIEVLAVLLKEEAKGTHGIERAAIDELMNSTAIGAA
ncbi:putative dna polymerase delta protein [Phaeoacremonium minimum UCRPA7]|uniref:Putative dna polymerase delta protein n=1 Tax=Phaeoacremonium minimum (strain UCR-PA7) TaxID=1286976 RepID=R8BM75_PHAM7|nr:putative dna polymerase delta protein [Phaeoacremonium minimum UCRPA7]EOO00459.1 putative dna polymerase delta protein [Phaeoacremonium minimum UCRPA7]